MNTHRRLSDEGLDTFSPQAFGTRVTISVTLAVLMIAAFSFTDFSTPNEPMTQKTLAHLDSPPMNRFQTLLSDPKYSICDDPLEVSISRRTKDEFVLSCGNHASVRILKDESVRIVFGNEEVAFSKAESTMHFSGSDDFNAGVLKLSAVLGAHGYNGKEFPETMPFHYYTLLLSHSGVATPEMVSAVVESTPGALSDDDETCTYSRSGGSKTGTGTGGSGIKKDSVCGGDVCMPSICGDCCFHMACYGYQYCCENCNSAEKALIGLDETCGSVPAWNAFTASCDAKYPDFNYCRNSCDGSSNPAPAPAPPAPSPSTPAPTAAAPAAPPAITNAPTKGRTPAPTAETTAPTEGPTKTPTKAPTKAPTKPPTKAPTKAPTAAPTAAPTKTPTKAPTKAPTQAPTQAPTKAPTMAPTKAATNAPTASSSGCPSDFSAEGDLCLKAVAKKLTWSDAQTACEDLGANLAVITTENEQEHLTAYLSDFYEANADVVKNEFWLGLTVHNSTAKWVDGTEFDFNEFRNEAEEMLGDEEEDGCVIQRDDGTTTYWDPRRCKKKGYYVCSTGKQTVSQTLMNLITKGTRKGDAGTRKGDAKKGEEEPNSFSYAYALIGGVGALAALLGVSQRRRASSPTATYQKIQEEEGTPLL
uniref:C-type lectin domain-containing protein n=1 Tax=Heterosigma akashiwo TaxID=2829 RepID=A0A7S3Y6P1_HETAK